LGSFPFVATLGGDLELARTYLEGIYNTTLIKDVSINHNIRDVGVLQSIVSFLCSNIGSQTSIAQVAKALNKDGRSISTNTVERYVSALTESYLFYGVKRFDIKGKQHLKTLGKYFCIDSGLREFLIADKSKDLSRLVENCVYLELRRRGNQVSVGKFDEKEIDFIATDAQGPTYYQVAVSVLAPEVLARELAPLDMLKDNYPKYLLTMDEVGSMANHNGIIQQNVIDWLLA
jgi:predicted AAA+ superfamily ATPase